MKISLDNSINRYTITAFLFLLWISILDSRYSWVKQYKLTIQLKKADARKKMYEQKLKEAKINYNDLMSNKEKYAREKYFIGKNGEDVYIIVNE